MAFQVGEEVEIVTAVRGIRPHLVEDMARRIQASFNRGPHRLNVNGEPDRGVVFVQGSLVWHPEVRKDFLARLSEVPIDFTTVDPIECLGYAECSSTSTLAVSTAK